MLVATRASELALRQARLVQSALERLGIDAELRTFRTTGDKRRDEPLPQIGAKGLFTAELENALRKGKVRCAVHSLKDLPTEMPPGIVLAAVLEREDPRDVLVVNPVLEATQIEELPRGSRVGTSSLRRRAQLRALRTDLEIVDLRGNVPTRLHKVDEGQVHAAILAAAGLLRLDAAQHIASWLEPPGWLPAPGQGAIAVQVRQDDDEALATIARLNHQPTAVATRAERAFLAALEGGCQVPIGALAVPSAENGRFTLYGLIADVSGATVVRGSRGISADDPEAEGEALAHELRGSGGERILQAIRELRGVPFPQPK